MSLMIRAKSTIKIKTEDGNKMDFIFEEGRVSDVLKILISHCKMTNQELKEIKTEI